MRIAMIGIKAIPARFGGFETAVDELSRGLVKLGHRVRVYNRSAMATFSGTAYEGVELVNLPTLKSKNLSTIVHALLVYSPCAVPSRGCCALLHHGRHAICPAAAPFRNASRLLCRWNRLAAGQMGVGARWYLRFSEKLAVLFCQGLISDSNDVMRYYRANLSRSIFLYCLWHL